MKICKILALPIIFGARRSLAVFCAKSCEEEWPQCVDLVDSIGGDGCRMCRESLADEHSSLVRRGNCLPGCKPTEIMEARCEGSRPPCEPSCSSEWPSCLHFFKDRGRENACDVCTDLLFDESSLLVRGGFCTLGCVPDDTMQEECASLDILSKQTV
uniref:Uncharacterized protein n=1 Tax=Corethron hystrix TaxID=216773 RepID=A0A6U5FNM3_9STRA|mmetsp:Transcript_23933/g.54473  ORF Transcript_23933/g.54473 Transcript_23933/m.54473 type:complete len:157 (+) Transcript_23933:405-875(+)